MPNDTVSKKGRQGQIKRLDAEIMVSLNQHSACLTGEGSIGFVGTSDTIFDSWQQDSAYSPNAIYAGGRNTVGLAAFLFSH